MHWWQRVVRACLACAAPPLGVATAALSVVGCAPHIGGHCNVNSDCSLQGSLQCDTSQPSGYCTLFNCIPNMCPNSASCVAVNANVPGCPYDDYMSPSRTAVDMCLESCTKDSDCRTSDGYVCADPRDPPWNAQILDNTIRLVCLLSPAYADAGALAPPEFDAAPAVCLAAGPFVDASVFASGDGAADAGADAMEGGPVEAGAGDGGAADAGAADAPAGG